MIFQQSETHVLRTGLWDRQGANIASHYKEMYGVELFLRLKEASLDTEGRILPWSYEKRRWLMLAGWNFKFLCD